MERQAVANVGSGQLAGILGQALMSVGCVQGLGNHIALLTYEQVVAARKWSWISQIVAINAIGFGKLAVIAFLLRIQDRTQNKAKWFLYFVGVGNVVINLDQSILMLTQCHPLGHQWDDRIPGVCPHVHRTNRVGYFAGSMDSSDFSYVGCSRPVLTLRLETGWSATSDVALAIYPLIVFRNLKVSRRVKLSLFALMSGGVLSVPPTALRLSFACLLMIGLYIQCGCLFGD